MKVICRHGHLAYYPQSFEELKRFERQNRIQLVSERDYFTFSGLIGLNRYSIQGHAYKNLPAITTFEGEGPWEVMRANSFVYSLSTGLLIPKDLVVTKALLSPIQDGGVCGSSFLQAGAILESTRRVVSYEGFVNLATQRLYIYSLETLT